MEGNELDGTGTIVACRNIARAIISNAWRPTADEQLTSMSDTGGELRKSTVFL